MEIIKYQDAYKQQVIDLILHIQNSEAKGTMKKSL